MALIIHTKNIDTQLLVWEMEEDPNFFRSRVQLSVDEISRYQEFKFEGRKKEFLCSRMVIQKFLDQDAKLAYYQDGRPYLKNSTGAISISHSKTHLGILVSHGGAPGLDIEMVSARPEKISEKFLSEEEKQFIHKKDERMMTLVWSAKEAVFKMMCKQGIDFRTDIKLEAFNIDELGVLNASFKDHKSVLKLKYQFIKGNVIVWGTDGG